jgi:hypothetical protein
VRRLRVCAQLASLLEALNLLGAVRVLDAEALAAKRPHGHVGAFGHRETGGVSHLPGFELPGNGLAVHLILADPWPPKPVIRAGESVIGEGSEITAAPADLPSEPTAVKAIEGFSRSTQRQYLAAPTAACHGGPTAI